VALRTGRLGAHITDGGFRKQPAVGAQPGIGGEGRGAGQQWRAFDEDNRKGRRRAINGEMFIKHARSGGGAQLQHPEDGGQKVYPFADWK